MPNLFTIKVVRIVTIVVPRSLVSLTRSPDMLMRTVSEVVQVGVFYALHVGFSEKTENALRKGNGTRMTDGGDRRKVCGRLRRRNVSHVRT